MARRRVWWRVFPGRVGRGSADFGRSVALPYGRRRDSAGSGLAAGHGGPAGPGLGPQGSCAGRQWPVKVWVPAPTSTEVAPQGRSTSARVPGGTVAVTVRVSPV